jgi:hypothetical protein
VGKVYDASNESQVQRRSERARSRDETQQRDLAALLDAPAGRRFVWRLLTQCGVGGERRLSYVQRDSNHTAFNEGVRYVGETLWAELWKDHFTALQTMISESKEDPDV